MNDSKKKYNFCAGPSTLPLEVKKKLSKSIINWNYSGISVLEINHRSKNFNLLYDSLMQKLKKVIDIPDNYSVLFLHGGASTQFFAIPLNILGNSSKACYVDTGTWSKKAINEARKYCNVLIAAEYNESKNSLPDPKNWYIDDSAAYLHYTSNETIDGIGFKYVPDINLLPIVSDMSSDIFTKPLNLRNFGLVYASTQKNIGISGMCIVFINKSIIRPNSSLSGLLNYNTQITKFSTYNTPSLFSWYATELMLEWIEKEGGLKKIEQNNYLKTKMLYDCIDSSFMYQNNININWRSNTNIIFHLTVKKLTTLFIEQAEKEGLLNIQGHPSKGGIRISLYNAMPIDGIKKLVNFMKFFEEENSRYLV